MNESEHADDNGKKNPGDHPVGIVVNFNPVTMPTRQATGLAIKQAAITQGVNIKVDFKLYRDKGSGRRDPIRDDETVPLHEGEKFEAVDGDDNS